jgi:hypothetical protein
MMGEFTQNLLKLTEFPFSYSLMGLLALIFGHSINLEELSFAAAAGRERNSHNHLSDFIKTTDIPFFF